MASQKQSKIAQIVREFAKQGDSYDITGINLGLAKYFWREAQGTFNDLAAGDYRIDTANGRQTLVVTNQSVVGLMESIQVAYILDFDASSYDTKWNVDINTLKDKYNQLVSTCSGLWEYIRSVGMVADDTTMSLILPQLDTDEIWIKTDTGYTALKVTDFRDMAGESLIEYMKTEKANINQINKHAVESLNTVRDNGITEINNSIGDITAHVDGIELDLTTFLETLKKSLNTYFNLLNVTMLANQKKLEDTLKQVPVQTNEIKNVGKNERVTVMQEGQKQRELLAQDGEQWRDQLSEIGNVGKKLDKGTYNGTASDLHSDIEANTVELSRKQNKENTIAGLQRSNRYKLGDVVEVLGYYSAGDGAGHKRKIEQSDDGSGVRLANNLWANLVHNGEVNVSWFGLVGDGVTDNTPLMLSKINFIKHLKVKFGQGYFAFDCLDLGNTQINISSTLDKILPEFVDSPSFEKSKGKTVFVAKRHDQDFVIKIGNETEFTRGVYLNNIQILTNTLRKENGKFFINYNEGSKKGLVCKNVCFSDIKKLIFTGHNPNLIAPFTFLGFETQHTDIMFRGVGTQSLGNPSYLGAYVIEYSNNPLAQLSGMVLDKFGFERTLPPYIANPSSNDVIINNINIESNLFDIGGNEIVDPDTVVDIETLAEKIPYFTFGAYIGGGVIYSNITGQNLGITYRKNGKLYTFDTLFKNTTKYGGMGSISISNVCMQNTLKDVVVIDSNGDKTNKIGDNLRRTEKYKVRDIYIAYSGEEQKVRSLIYNIKDSVELDIDERSKFSSKTMYKEDVFIANILDCKLNYNNNRFNTRVRYDKKLKKEIIIPAFEKTTPEEEGVIFETDKLFSCFTNFNTKQKHKVSIRVTYINNQWSDVQTKVCFLCTDGSLIESIPKYFYKTESGTSECVFFVDIPSEKTIKEFYIKNTVSTYRYLYIVEVEIKSTNGDLELLNIDFGKDADNGIKSMLHNVNLDSMKTTTVNTRAINIMSISKFSQGVPNNENHYMLLNMNNSNSASSIGTATQLLVQEVTGRMFVRTIVGETISIKEISTVGAIQSLDTPYYTTKMQREGVYEDFVNYMDLKIEYDNHQRELEVQRQQAFTESGVGNYEEWLATQPQMLPNLEPIPSEALLKFKEKYLG